VSGSAPRRRALLEAAAGPAVAYRAQIRRVQRALERPRAARPEDDVPPEAAAEIVQASMSATTGLLDEPLPALDGRTPREP